MQSNLRYLCLYVSEVIKYNGLNFLWRKDPNRTKVLETPQARMDLWIQLQLEKQTISHLNI